MQRASRPEWTRQPRRGAVIVIAMIGLLLTSMIGASLLKTALTQHRQVERRQKQLQARWLAQAGLERAAARLADDAGYTGETWTIPPSALGGRDEGVVRIEVRSEDAASGHQVRIEARFPSEGHWRSRESRTFVVGREPAE